MFTQSNFVIAKRNFIAMKETIVKRLIDEVFDGEITYALKNKIERVAELMQDELDENELYQWLKESCKTILKDHGTHK